MSGGLWLRGGIPFRREDGRAYATRNRVVLCRCGRSADKPFCDGTHATVKWHDGLDDATAAPERTTARAALGCRQAPEPAAGATCPVIRLIRHEKAPGG